MQLQICSFRSYPLIMESVSARELALSAMSKVKCILPVLYVESIIMDEFSAHFYIDQVLVEKFQRSIISSNPISAKT